VAGLGRFGPYIKHGDDYRSLEATDDLFTVDLARALALLAAPKRSARQAAKRVIRKIDLPDGAAPLQVLEGRFGPYVTDGETNASIPRGADPATISLEDVQALLEARRGAPPREPRRGRRGAASRGRGRRAAKPVEKVAAKPAPASKAQVAGKAKAKPKPKAAGRKRTVRKRAS
jgi:DNA topoisomerase I